jgi:hypothetical protein
MRVESIYTTSYIIGSGPQGKTEVHRKEIDDKGFAVYTVETHPFFSYSANGQIEAVKELGKNVDKFA